jgi:phosphatidate cytidylyltransferase
MFLQRLIVTIILLPIGLWAMFAGETQFGIMMMIILIIAMWEYTNLFKIGGYKPAVFILLTGTVLFSLTRLFFGQQWVQLIMTGLVLGTMAFHSFAYERGRDESAMDMMISFGGLVYVAFIGSFFIAIRSLPGGDWWMIVVFTSVWWADTGGYFIGKAFGKHRLAPRLSPKKSWEGYLAGIVLALGGSVLLLKIYYLLNLPVDPAITYPRVMLVGAFLSIFPTIGDLGISMLKRYFTVKDSGKILPGHGGMLDRIDSWLWAAAIGYYLITLCFLT